MLFLKSHRKQIIGLLFLTLFYFSVRLLPNLNTLPIFTDEAIYMRWAQIALHDSSWRFISLTDGKQPLYVWIAMVFQKFISDPLIAGRLVSVFSGFFTLIGLILISKELFKNKIISFITGILYIVYPFAQIYDRMALMDGMVGTFAVWGLLFGILLVRKIRLDIAYTLGFIIGGAALTKSNGFFSAALLPFTLFLLDWKRKSLRNTLARWATYAGLAFLISLVMYSILRLSPFFHIIAEKNAIFVYPISEWLKHPFTYFLSNIQVLIGWLMTYFNVFTVLLILGLLNKKFIRENLVSVSYFVIPFIFLGLFGRTIYPRYIYPMTLSLLPICAMGLYYVVNKLSAVIKNNKFPWVLVPIFLAYPLFVSLNFAANPNTAPIADADQNQYIKLWPAGWGVKESVAFFANQAQNQKIYVGTQGTFGLMPFGLELYLVNNPNVTLRGYWPINEEPPKDLIDHSRIMPTYMLFYQPCPPCENTFSPPRSWNVKKVLSAPQGNLAVYQIFP